MAIRVPTASAPSNRHGAASVTQFELLPQPPDEENKPLVWPYWPIKLRTSSSARGRLLARLVGGDQGIHRRERQADGPEGVPRVEWKDGRSAGSARQRVRAAVRTWAPLAMGFTNPVRARGCSKPFGVRYGPARNVRGLHRGEARTTQRGGGLRRRRRVAAASASWSGPSAKTARPARSIKQRTRWAAENCRADLSQRCKQKPGRGLPGEGFCCRAGKSDEPPWRSPGSAARSPSFQHADSR